MPFDPPIQTLSLDAGGVLTFPNWNRVSDALARHDIIVAADALRAAEPLARRGIDEAAAVAATKDADRGSRYFRNTLALAGVPFTADVARALDEVYAYHTEHNLWEDVPDDVPVALERLKAMGLTMVVASNANGALHTLFDRVGLTKYFDGICDSRVEGVEKPDRRFFEIVLARVGARAETTLHVGDLYHVDVMGARGAGMRALLLDPNDLYADADADRVRSLDDVADRIGGR